MSGEARGPFTPGRAGLPGVLLAVLLLVLPAASPAPAATASPGARIADALRHSPVYVDAAYAGAVPPSRQRRLAAQIRRTGLPIDVALVPLVKGDAFDGDPQILADVVHERLGRRSLVLITMDEYPDSLAGHEWPGDAHQARDAVDAVGFLHSMKDAGLADRVAKAVSLVAAGDGTSVYHKATADLGGAAPGASPRPAGTGGGVWLPVLCGLLGVTVVALCVAGALRRRRRRAVGPFAFPQAVFAAARAADESDLRRHAEAEVLALGEAVRAADAEAVPLLSRALEAYAAAGTVVDGARGLPDLAGVLALVAGGRDALAGRAAALPLCFFNPLHGRAERRTRWRPMGRREQLEVAVCRECAQAVRTRRPPEVLTDVRRDGRKVPYFEVPAEESVWAATGYGSLLEADDDLAGRVARGDFSRGRRD